MSLIEQSDGPLDDIAIVLGLGGAGGCLCSCSDGSHVDRMGGERFFDDSLGEKRQCEGKRLVVEKNETRDLATGQEKSSRLLLYNVIMSCKLCSRNNAQ
jgi:hypothetical protein